MIESPFASQRYVREFQYSCLEFFAHIQAEIAGQDYAIQKGIFDWMKGAADKIFGKVSSRPRLSFPKIRIGTQHQQDDINEAETKTFEFLQSGFNPVYESMSWKGGLIGIAANRLKQRGYDLSGIKNLTINEFNELMKEGDDDDWIDDPDEFLSRTGFKKESQMWASRWYETNGAKWLAVYDKDGNRSGRSYEVCKNMISAIIQRAIDEDLPIDKIRQRLLYIKDSEVRKEFTQNGKFNEAAYQAFFWQHLNRDMVRVAVTETSYAYNNGLLMRGLHKGNRYMIFTGG